MNALMFPSKLIKSGALETDRTLLREYVAYAGTPAVGKPFGENPESTDPVLYILRIHRRILLEAHMM